MAMLLINIARLAEGEHRYSLSVEASDIGLGEEFRGPVSLEAGISRAGRQYLLDAAYSASVAMTCDRCLKDFEGIVTGTYSILYLAEPGSGETGGHSKDEDEEVQVLPADAQVITLDDDLRQYVNLGIPGKVLCSEECKGLCPTCGTNWNESACSCEKAVTDPRWDALKTLTKKHSSH